MTRCDECYQRFAQLEREIASQKQIIDALIAVADKVIAQRDAPITDAQTIREAFERDCG